MNSSLRYIFECLKMRITQKVDWVKNVSIYQQQDLFQEQSKGFNTPHVFIDFSNIEYRTMSRNIQECELDITLKIVIEDYSKDYLNALDKASIINSYVNNYTAWNNNLERVESTTDITADSLYVFDIIYSTKFKEDTTPADSKKIEIGHGTDNPYCINVSLCMGSTTKIIEMCPDFLLVNNIGENIVLNDGANIQINI